MSLTDETYDRWLGVVNVDRREPIREAGGKAWFTRGGKTGRAPEDITFALIPDQWGDDFPAAERLPSGVVAEDPRGVMRTVP